MSKETHQTLYCVTTTYNGYLDTRYYVTREEAYFHSNPKELVLGISKVTIPKPLHVTRKMTIDTMHHKIDMLNAWMAHTEEGVLEDFYRELQLET